MKFFSVQFSSLKSLAMFRFYDNTFFFMIGYCGCRVYNRRDLEKLEHFH